jgi:O-acetyl-ADP-ribose deacetylase (regulator of RNase III)
VAFPSLSTGAYGYPVELAAPIALSTVAEYLQSHAGIERVRFVLYSRAAYATYERALEDLAEGQGWSAAKPECQS